MTFELTAEQEHFKQSIEQFAREVVAPERALLTMPSEKLNAHPKSFPLPAPICFVVRTHSDPVLKNARGVAGNAAGSTFAPACETSSIDAS